VGFYGQGKGPPGRAARAVLTRRTRTLFSRAVSREKRIGVMRNFETGRGAAENNERIRANLQRKVKGGTQKPASGPEKCSIMRTKTTVIRKGPSPIQRVRGVGTDGASCPGRRRKTGARKSIQIPAPLTFRAVRCSSDKGRGGKSSRSRGGEGYIGYAGLFPICTWEKDAHRGGSWQDACNKKEKKKRAIMSPGSKADSRSAECPSY